MTDPDIKLLWEYFQHIKPGFTIKHVLVYKLLWRVEPKTGEQVIEETKFARGTAYKILKDLFEAGFVSKTSFKPVGYYAENPVKAYSIHTKKLVAKLERGKEQLKQLMENSSGLSSELYLIKLDGGQQKLLVKKDRETVKDEQELIKIKKAIDNQLDELHQSKVKAWVRYK